MLREKSKKNILAMSQNNKIGQREKLIMNISKERHELGQFSAL